MTKIKFAAVSPEQVHPDFQANGIAPLVGKVLHQIAEENSDAGHFAEGILRTGDHSLLPIFADKLQDDGHPHAESFDWRHLPRAIKIDRAMNSVLAAADAQQRRNGRYTEIIPSEYSDNWRWGRRGVLSRKKALTEIRKVVPDANKHDLHHSVQRMSVNRVKWTDPNLPEWWTTVENQHLKQLGTDIPDAHKYPDTRPPKKRTYNRKAVRLLFSRLRSHFETQTLMGSVGTAQKQWMSSPSNPYPSDHLLAAARYLNKEGDPRGEIVSHYADTMDGLHDQNPIHQHINSPEQKTLHSATVPLPDGSHLFVQSHGHSYLPGVHAVSFRWSPKGSVHNYNSHWHPDEARFLADKFMTAHPTTGKLIHEALDKGEAKAEGLERFEREGNGGESDILSSPPLSVPRKPLKFSKVEEGDFHDAIHSNPGESTHALAYADWLQEQGREAQAEIIRKHVERTGDSGFPRSMGMVNRSHYIMAGQHPDWTWTATGGTVPWWEKPYTVHLLHRDPNNPDRALMWSTDHLPTPEAHALISRLTEEGKGVGTVGHDHNASTLHRLYPEHAKPAENTPEKFAAYRSPQGGMVVDHVFYPGGSLVPDLQKEEFSADADKPKPKKKPKSRHHHLKKRLRKVFTGGYFGDQNSYSEGEADGGE